MKEPTYEELRDMTKEQYDAWHAGQLAHYDRAIAAAARMRQDFLEIIDARIRQYEKNASLANIWEPKHTHAKAQISALCRLRDSVMVMRLSVEFFRDFGELAPAATPGL